MEVRTVMCDLCDEMVHEPTSSPKRRLYYRVKINIFQSLNCGRTYEKTFDVCEKCLDKVEGLFNIDKGEYKV